MIILVWPNILDPRLKFMVFDMRWGEVNSIMLDFEPVVMVSLV